MFDSDQAYAQVTQPLRNLTRKGIHFEWKPECEEAYKKILELMTQV